MGDMIVAMAGAPAGESLALARALLSALAHAVFGAIIAFISFGAATLATRLDKAAEAAAIRELSIMFGAAIGALIFRESIDARRTALIGAIAAGAIVIELG